MPIDIPEGFARSMASDAGEAGRTWIDALPAVLDELLQQWSCTPDGEVMHGRVGIVVPVRHRDLPPAVMKVSFPHSWTVSESAAFAAWDGAGAVRLYARAGNYSAMLLERAARGTLADVADPERAVAIQGALARRLAVTAPPGFPTLSAQIAPWEHEISTAASELGHPLPRRTVDAALATVRELGPDQPQTLVHGDLHDANVLGSDREDWLAIDPKVCVGDPAYDAFTAIYSPRFGDLIASPDPRPTLLRLLDIYCDAAEVDVERARRWTQAGAVREALRERRHSDSAELVQAADRLALALT
ncbi:aminoglycoside phosphotransferase family protein [Nocardia sp. alder85J]|uniref:aminoglycoside phosphotransferase family protein n=1 Tax=Nocardia sp. alder85J TaxID=2862949 RepID=UPI001CD7B5F9|nr:aminoglycoside phosphotransferase family protein [Nocardia sp. alder85J]MCX4091211.1 phosphotransferase [Nocardia sp. alder85J]